MAGSFGYHAGEHHDVSVRVWQHGLEPALADVPADTLMVAGAYALSRLARR